MNNGIQSAFENAMAESLGFVSVQAVLDAVPPDKQLTGNPTQQDRINHAFAIAFGFDSTQDMVDAQGMRGRKGLSA
ncbi:hypothetical protein FDI21_gp291 [Pseudomonas phage Noxifer]|uniref:Uncharacterized protein n=1 Tax=Pseudomonas phage Noxifer TaxID=2006684 RepID=A0A1Y0SVH1_9CAUD|nr:hypothetical protein FDI21_gp291 [Pseudomonas phage Noxifer]ARV77420.1 hypothetical protein NOXIFER_255 [Pseudomonas phage Noxifer]